VGDLLRREPWLAGFTVAHVAAFTVVGVALERPFLWVYMPLLAAAAIVVVLIDRRGGPLPGALLWMLSLWAAAHLAGGLLGDPSGRRDILYNWWLVDGLLRWDQVVHGFGIGVVTVVVVFAARRSQRPWVVGLVWGQGIGVGNELVENTFATFVEGSNVGDAVNTAWDMAFHLIGGAAALLWMWRTGFPQSSTLTESPTTTAT